MKRAAGSILTTSNRNRILECPDCQKPFRSDILKKHMKTHNKSEECAYCKRVVRIDMMQTHLKTHNPSRRCKFCKKMVRTDLLIKHEILCKDQVDETLCNRQDCKWLDTHLECSALSGCFKKFNLSVENSLDYDEILANVTNAAGTFLHDLISAHPVKAQMVLDLQFYHDSYEGREFASKIFRSIMEPLLVGDNLDKYLARARIYLKSQIELYERNGSGWQFSELSNAWLEVSRYSPLSGSGTVGIPKLVKDMKSVLNITAPDNKCFLYCILAKLFQASKHPERYTNYLEHKDAIKFGDLTFPMKIADIGRVESLNNISISVFEWSKKDKGVIPIHHGSGVGTQIDLLYIRDAFTGHYLLIKNFNAFMRHRSKHHNSMHFCRRCLHGFTKHSGLTEHSTSCHQGINQITKLPDPGTVTEFTAIHKKDKKLFAVYFDFECLTVPIKEDSENVSKTTKYQQHIPCSFCIVTKSEFDDYNEETTVYSDEDPDKLIATFLDELERVYDEMMKCYVEHQHPIHMTAKDEDAFLSATYCHICKKDLDWESEKNYPVRDHDHSKKMNNYRGAACNSCM